MRLLWISPVLPPLGRFLNTLVVLFSYFRGVDPHANHVQTHFLPEKAMDPRSLGSPEVCGASCPGAALGRRPGPRAAEGAGGHRLGVRALGNLRVKY